MDTKIDTEVIPEGSEMLASKLSVVNDSVQPTTRLLIGATICLLTCFLGCGKVEQKAKTYPLSGKVTRTGDPVANATVVLHSKNAFPFDVPAPRGTTDEKGAFQITTYESGDGAPEGEYEISLEQWYRDDPNSSPTNHLPKNLSFPSTSGLKVQVIAGENPALELAIP